MNQKKTESETPRIDPCEHMQERVSALADGSLKGMPSWYTRFHVFHCSRCGAALKELRALLARVRTLKAVPPALKSSKLTPERVAQLRAEIDRVDRKYCE
jgi:hypothetical protein